MSVYSNHVFILGNFTRHSRLHQPLHRHYQKEGRCKYIITTFWASFSYSFFPFDHFSFLLSQWMLLCSLWLTLPPSLSSLWIQFSSVCLTLVLQQSSSRRRSTPSSFKVSDNLHSLGSSFMKFECVYRCVLLDRRYRNTDRLVDHHTWNRLHLHLLGNYYVFLDGKLGAALPGPHPCHPLYHSHFLDEVLE